MVDEPGPAPATIVSLPEPPIITALETDVPVLCAKRLEDEDAEAFRVSFPPAAIRKSGLPLPVRLTDEPGAPKIVADPAPLFTVALDSPFAPKTTPPEPAVIDSGPVPPRMLAVCDPPTKVRLPDPAKYVTPPTEPTPPDAFTVVGLGPPTMVSPLPVSVIKVPPAVEAAFSIIKFLEPADVIVSEPDDTMVSPLLPAEAISRSVPVPPPIVSPEPAAVMVLAPPTAPISAPVPVAVNTPPAVPVNSVTPGPAVIGTRRSTVIGYNTGTRDGRWDRGSGLDDQVRRATASHGRDRQ